VVDFVAWPKTPRLLRGMTITEKIDGTNSAVHIRKTDKHLDPDANPYVYDNGDSVYEVIAQSRNRLLTPESDNFGFAQWVDCFVFDLIDLLGEGTHFGEWWGSGIQRGYGLPKGERRFSLFDVDRYEGIESRSDGLLRTVPVLYRGVFDTAVVRDTLTQLGTTGSRAAEGYDNPEGVIVWHTAAQHCFKLTFDDLPKG
jgi:hypothetical protein